MKILIFALGERGAPEGGVGTYIRTITKILQDRGHTVDWLYHSDGELLPDERLKKIAEARKMYYEQLKDCHPLVPHFESTKYECMQVLETFGSSSYDIIHSQNGITSYAARQVCPSTPLVGTVHGSYYSDIVCSGRVDNYDAADIFRRYDDYSVSCPTKVIAVSSSIDENLPPIPEDKHEIIYNGIDLNLFKPVPHNNDLIKIATSGSFLEYKGYDLLMHALVILKNQGYQFELTMFGAGPQKIKLENIARANQLPVHFRGEVPREVLASELPNHNIFVQPSRAENFPFSVIEAMACGCVPVVTKVGGMKEQVEHMKNGMLCTEENVYELAKALSLLIRDRSKIEEMGQQARATVCKRFSLEKMGERLEEVYTKTISAHSSKLYVPQAV